MGLLFQEMHLNLSTEKRVLHPQPIDLLPVLQVFAEQARAATLQSGGDDQAVVEAEAAALLDAQSAHVERGAGVDAP